jgi:hypothetical protein
MCGLRLTQYLRLSMLKFELVLLSAVTRSKQSGGVITSQLPTG